MLCDYESCPMNAVFKKQGQGYIGFCTISEKVTINMDGRCKELVRLFHWFNSD